MECFNLVRNIIDTKVRTLIKAYLSFHKGKKCSSFEIADWINDNGFGLNNYTVNPKRISYYVNSGRHCKTNMLYGVNVEKVNGMNHFWIG